MAEFNKIIGNAIKLLREELGMTQAQLADRAGVNQQTIDRIEKARFNSSISLIQQVLQAMGATLMIAPVEISDQKRFLLQESKEQEGCYVVTDTENGIICKFESHNFNATQKLTLLENPSAEIAAKIPKLVREMGDWLQKNYKDIL